MAYIISPDLSRSIQEANLQQIIGNDSNVLSGAILAGEAEAKSYLTQKYELADEFKDLYPWAPAIVYKAGDRVYLTAPLFSLTATYAVNALVTYNGNVYRCSIAVTIPGAFNPASWNNLGLVNQIYNVKYPAPIFQYNGVYNVGDKVFWNNSTYTCRIQTPLLDHTTGIQYRAIQNLPLPNPAPDDINSGVTYWGVGVPFVFTAGTLPTNTLVFADGDTRDQQMVLYLIDIVLYHIHSRIAPRNIPDLRVKRYDDAVKWLKMAAQGEVTPALRKIQPHTGNRIRYGGNIKLINSY
jgi:hypothetical protein